MLTEGTVSMAGYGEGPCVFGALAQLGAFGGTTLTNLGCLAAWHLLRYNKTV